MTCQYDRDRLSLLVSDELEPDEATAVTAHLAGCADCRAVVEQYRAGVALLQEPPTAIPYRRPAKAPRRRPIWIAASIAAAFILTMTLSPAARVALAELLGFPTVKVREKVITWQVPGYRQEDDANQIRLEQVVNPGPGERRWTYSLAEVRALVGEEVLLPPTLVEGAPVTVFRNLDQHGKIRYASLEMILIEDLETYGSAGWYEAQFWPGGQLRETKLTFGANWQVRIEETQIGGRPARVIQGHNLVTQETHYEIWLYQGDWLYKLKSHNPAVTVERLREAAASLQ